LFAAATDLIVSLLMFHYHITEFNNCCNVSITIQEKNENLTKILQILVDNAAANEQLT